MIFVVAGIVKHGTKVSSSSNDPICILERNSWDDYGFKTSFDARVIDEEKVTWEIGSLRIAKAGMKSGFVVVPEVFDCLGDEYCSLGNDEDYYRNLAALPRELSKQFLDGLRDVVSNFSIYTLHSNEEVMNVSLLRFTNLENIEISYRNALLGRKVDNQFRFTFTTENKWADNAKLEFSVDPQSYLPTNIHVVIGRNGVGKTRLLAGMASALISNENDGFGTIGKFAFDKQNSSQYSKTQFLNLVVVSFSVFDKFDPVSDERRQSIDSIPYNYIGIKSVNLEPNPQKGSRSVIKSLEDMTTEFEYSVRNVLANSKTRPIWNSAMEILSSDPLISDMSMSESIEENFTDYTDMQLKLTESFGEMSSGHKIVFLTLVKLIETVREQSLVIIDEPETHLHPPLLGSLVRALSGLLKKQNAVAIIATHSPVVLQEVPRTCVQIVSRSGDAISISRPDTETFAENVGVITRQVFKLELTNSGFYKLLRDSANGRNFEEVLDQFQGQVGAEGRALVRSLVRKAGTTFE